MDGHILDGVKAYVDVRSSDGKANYSMCVREQLQLLGADVLTQMTKQCTHVVFKDGKINTRIHANKLGLTLVNVLWVERCRETNSRCDEALFPVTDDTKVSTPAGLRKNRRYRSLQPKESMEKVTPTLCRKNKEVSRRSSRLSRLGEESDSSAAEKSAPLKPKNKTIKKLQWPPDHSDVCSEAELAEHSEISKDLQKARRKLKRSDEFLDTSIKSPKKTKAKISTKNFVVSKASAKPATTTDEEEEDSQMSLYDASQHFERKDYSITNMITKLDATMEKVSDSSISESDDDLFLSPAKRKCDLTNSQKNVMEKTFEFDEIEEVSKPRRRRKKKIVATEQLLDDTSKQTVLTSPTKLLTFSSNYNDNSDIVTDLDAASSKTEELHALKQLKSPAVVNKQQKKPKPERHALNSETSITIKICNKNEYRSVPHTTIHIPGDNGKKIEVSEIASSTTAKTKRRSVAPEKVKDKHTSPNLQDYQSKFKEPEIGLAPVLPKVDISTAGKVPSTIQEIVTEEPKRILQEPEISSTSGVKSIAGEGRTRRVSKRLRHSSSKVRNPDFVCEDRKIGSILRCPDPEPSEESETNKEPVQKSTNRRIGKMNATDCENVSSHKSTTRRSSRKRRSNPKYPLDDESDQTSEKTVSKEAPPTSDSTENFDSVSLQSSTASSSRRTSRRNNNSISEDHTGQTTQNDRGKVINRKRLLKKSISLASSTDSLVDLSQRCSPATDQTSATGKVICTTCCHRDDQAVVRHAACMLASTISNMVTKETTHVVMGTPKRTINLLKAIIHGSHVLSLNWVTESISNNAWKSESKYTLTSDFPVLKIKGEKRRNMAEKLFCDVGLIFIEKDTAPPREDLNTLIELCGGKVTASRTRSKYCIGGAAPAKEHVSLSEQWVLDSISKLKLQDINKYILYPFRSPSPEF